MGYVNLAFTHLTFHLIHALISAVVRYMDIQDGDMHIILIIGLTAVTLR